MTYFSPHYLFIIASGLFITLIAIILAACVGEIPIDITMVLKTISNKLFQTQYDLPTLEQNIIWNYRLSRSVMAAICGSSLALSGMILQTLLRNNLADPYLLGISNGAAAGAVSFLLLGVGGHMINVSFSAFMGALVACCLVGILAFKAGRSYISIILSGIAVSQIFHALTCLIITKTATSHQTQGLMFWLMGNLSGVGWIDIQIGLPVAFIGLIICLLNSRSLNAFTFGEKSAISLGISIKYIYLILLTTAAMMTAVMVSLVGAIGFVGLVIPHIARFFVGINHMYVIPMSGFIGSIFLILCDVLSRILLDGQTIPIGVVSALIGAPIFSVILYRGHLMR